jgi:hypothetical protein
VLSTRAVCSDFTLRTQHFLIFAGCSKSPSSKAAGESKPEAYPLGYVEDFDEMRTKLEAVFNILLKGEGSFHHHHTLPPHLDRLNNVVVRFNTHKNLRRALDLIALFNNDLCRGSHIYCAILHQIRS